MLSEVLECFWDEAVSEDSSAKARFLRPLLWEVKMESRLLLLWEGADLEGRGRLSLFVVEVARREVRDVAKVRFEALVLEEGVLLRGVALEG